MFDPNTNVYHYRGGKGTTKVYSEAENKRFRFVLWAFLLTSLVGVAWLLAYASSVSM